MPQMHAVVVDEVLAEAAGVLSQARAALRTDTAWRVRMGVWRRYGDVVVTHNGPLTDVQQRWVAILRAGPGAVLAATSALDASGIRVDRPSLTQIVVPYSRGPVHVPDAVVRRSRVLGPTDVDRHRQPPRMTAARAAVDSATLLRDGDDIRAVLCAPVQQRRAHVRELRAAALRLGPLAGRGIVLRTLDELELGATTVHEQAFSRLVRRHGLPRADFQVLVRRGAGWAFLDVAWSAYRVHVEIDGLAHLLVRQWVDDLDRSNELEIAKSERRLRFPGFLLLEREMHVADQLCRALRAGGWSG